MTVTEAPESSTGNEGETAGYSDTRTQTIPYSRFAEVNNERKTYQSKVEALEKQLAEYSQTQPQKVAKQEGAAFKEKYDTIDEFYGDIAKKAANDPDFLDLVLDNLFKVKGDKFDETLFNSLSRKQQKIAQESEQITQKMVEEQESKLDKIEASFGPDKAGYEGFRTWVESVIGTEDAPNENVPSWAKDLDSLYDVYKEFKYQQPQVPQAARRISRAKISGKTTPDVDLSGDFHDVLKRMSVN